MCDTGRTESVLALRTWPFRRSWRTSQSAVLGVPVQGSVTPVGAWGLWGRCAAVLTAALPLSGAGSVAPRASSLEDLVASAAGGDRIAVARLLEMLRPLLVRYCRGRLGAMDSA